MEKAKLETAITSYRKEVTHSYASSKSYVNNWNHHTFQGLKKVQIYIYMSGIGNSKVNINNFNIQKERKSF